MATNTIAVLTAENKTFYDRVLLERLEPYLLHAQWGQKKSIPGNEGGTINFRRFSALSAATTALTEGVTPSGSAATVTAITATPAQYGDYMEVSDVLDMVGIDPVITELTQVLGEQAGLTIDTVVRDVIIAGSTVQRANSRAARTDIVATDVLNSTEVRKAVRTLRRNNAKPMKDGFYVGIVHPDAVYDFQSDSMWQDVAVYGGQEQIYKGEIGRMWGVRFVMSTQAKCYTGGGSGAVNVFGTLIIGQDYYGVVDIAGGSKPKTIVKPMGSGGTADPLDQRGSVGWKTFFTAVRLQELAAVRIEHGATA